MSLMNQFRRVREFLSPENLGQTRIRYKPLPGDVRLARDLALLVIDVQEEFCDPNGSRGNAETKRVSQRIKDLVPEFRKAGVPVYVIYFSSEKKKVKDVDFYEFRPERGDFVISKSDDSAFRGSEIEKILKRHGRKTLLACGFNLNACVYDTVMDARNKGFSVRLLRDLTGNDNDNDGSNCRTYLKRMAKNGVLITNAENELHAIGVANFPSPRHSKGKRHCRPRSKPTMKAESFTP